MSKKAWIGVDLDGTLAEWNDGQSIMTIGEPTRDPETHETLMLDRVKEWLRVGITVKIVTARVAETASRNDQGVLDDHEFAVNQRKMIEEWCKEYVGQALEVTATKDMHMFVLWDDRVCRVETNTGRLIG